MGTQQLSISTMAMSSSLAMTLTTHTLTIPGIHIKQLVCIKAILITPKDHPQ